MNPPPAMKPEDESEYLQLITGHQGMLYAFILSIHPDRAAAQDILQESSLVLWNKRDSFEMGTNFKAWAFRVARLQTLAHLKRIKQRSWLVFEGELADTLGAEAAEMLDDFQERRQALRKCVARMDKQDLWLVRAFYIWRMPFADISSRIGRSAAALKQAMFRIRRNLRGCIEQNMNHPA